jgi:hypothetical protein
MRSFDVRPILDSDLPQLAAFLQRWRANQRDEVAPPSITPQIERRLRWLLEENPAVRGTTPHGYCVRDNSGAIRGADVAFPWTFVANGTRLTGYCSGAFFVEPAARTLGTFLFKKYLSVRDVSFFFATTCNAESGPIWKAVGGNAVPNHDREYLFPFRLDVVLKASFKGRFRPVTGAASHCARVLNPVAQILARRPSGLLVTQSSDWEKLSALFYRQSQPNVLTTDRTASWLEWRYGVRGPNSAKVYIFRDKRGHEGWFALGQFVRGTRAPIRGQILLDAVWPSDSISLGDIFPTILRIAALEGGDALSLQPRAGVDYARCSRLILSWPIPPRIFVVTRKGQVNLPLSNFDLVPADGDSAFRISGWPPALDQRNNSGSTTVADRSESLAQM